MPSVSDLQALDLLHRLPDDALLTTAEAAVFLRSSVRSLERLRQPGEDGPGYVQPGGAGTKGRNQKCLYRKAELNSWIQRMTVTDSTAAAVRKGQLFMSLADLAEPEAHWINPEGAVAGLVEETDVGVFFERLGKWEIRWMDPLEAAGEKWESLSALKTHAESLDERLGAVRNILRSAVERAELEGEG